MKVGSDGSVSLFNGGSWSPQSAPFKFSMMQCSMGDGFVLNCRGLHSNVKVFYKGGVMAWYTDLERVWRDQAHCSLLVIFISYYMICFYDWGNFNNLMKCYLLNMWSSKLRLSLHRLTDGTATTSEGFLETQGRLQLTWCLRWHITVPVRPASSMPMSWQKTHHVFFQE